MADVPLYHPFEQYRSKLSIKIFQTLNCSFLEATTNCCHPYRREREQPGLDGLSQSSGWSDMNRAFEKSEIHRMHLKDSEHACLRLFFCCILWYLFLQANENRQTKSFLGKLMQFIVCWTSLSCYLTLVLVKLRKDDSKWQQIFIKVLTDNWHSPQLNHQ